MKNMYFLLTIIFISLSSFGQSVKTKHLLNEINGQWSLDDNGNVTYIKIVTVPNLTKDQIYNRALDYFIYNYGSGKSVIQTKDKELGRIVAKGLFDNVHTGVSLITTQVSCWHIVRVDVKDGKARIILTLTEYQEVLSGSGSTASMSTKVEENYPINPKGYNKTVMGKAFYKSHKAALATLEKIEKAIKEGNTSKRIENDNW